MSTTQIQAVDDMLSLVKAAATAASVGTVVYDDQPVEIPTDASVWARATIQHNIAPQRTLGEPGGRVFERQGFLFIQLFTPKGRGRDLIDQYSVAFRNAFEGIRTTNGVWFPEVAVREAGSSGNWVQTNVVAEFKYEEVK